MAVSNSITGNECLTQITKQTTYNSKNEPTYKFDCISKDEINLYFKCPKDEQVVSLEIKTLKDGTKVELHRCLNKITKEEEETFEYPCTGSTFYDSKLYQIEV